MHFGKRYRLCGTSMQRGLLAACTSALSIASLCRLKLQAQCDECSLQKFLLRSKQEDPRVLGLSSRAKRGTRFLPAAATLVA